MNIWASLNFQLINIAAENNKTKQKTSIYIDILCKFI